MGKMAGYLAILLGMLSFAPSIVPGAFSLFGLVLSLVALLVSLFSVRANGRHYFVASRFITVSGILLVNDALRLWRPFDLPVRTKLVMYGASLFVILGGTLAAAKLDKK